MQHFSPFPACSLLDFFVRCRCCCCATLYFYFYSLRPSKDFCLHLKFVCFPFSCLFPLGRAIFRYFASGFRYKTWRELEKGVFVRAPARFCNELSLCLVNGGWCVASPFTYHGLYMCVSVASRKPEPGSQVWIAVKPAAGAGLHFMPLIPIPSGSKGHCLADPPFCFYCFSCLHAHNVFAGPVRGLGWGFRSFCRWLAGWLARWG